MGPNRKAFLYSWLPALAGMAVLFYTSSLPGNEIQLPPFPYSDKVVHFAAYTALGALIAWRKRLRLRFAGKVSSGGVAGHPAESTFAVTGTGFLDFRGMVVGMLYGVGDEVHQIFVPMRMYDYSDMAADSLGVMAGIWLLGKWTGASAGKADG